MYDIVGKRNWYFAFSALLTIPGLIFILVGGLRPSIDFTGGTEWEIRYADEPSAAEMSAALAELGHPDAVVTGLPEGFLRIRTDPIDLAPAPTPVPLPTPSPTGTESPGPSPTASVRPSPGASPTTSPAASPSGSPAGSPSPSPTPPAAVEGAELAGLQGAR